MLTTEDLAFIHNAIMSTQFQGGAMRKAARLLDKIEALLAPKPAAPAAPPAKAPEPKAVAPGEPVEALA